ncbi:MAG: BrnT family toxin [Leptospiraceae bacterium]|nr:BrnT family toxin [Leptospiraceae bacterium]
MVSADETHSQNEFRFAALGITNEGRKLFVIFTIRKSKIRIISAQDMSKKERNLYKNIDQKNT